MNSLVLAREKPPREFTIPVKGCQQPLVKFVDDETPDDRGTCSMAKGLFTFPIVVIAVSILSKLRISYIKQRLE